MKANIHPEMKEATVKCACGETFNRQYGLNEQKTA